MFWVFVLLEKIFLIPFHRIMIIGFMILITILAVQMKLEMLKLHFI